jgi:hypothetical protein
MQFSNNERKDVRPDRFNPRKLTKLLQKTAAAVTLPKPTDVANGIEAAISRMGETSGIAPSVALTNF